MRAANAAGYWATAVKLSIRSGHPYSARQCVRDNVLYIIQHPESHTLWSAATSQIVTSAGARVRARAHTHTHTHTHTHSEGYSLNWLSSVSPSACLRPLMTSILREVNTRIMVTLR